MLARDTDILQSAEDWRRAGKGVALATVVAVGLMAASSMAPMVWRSWRANTAAS